jgi:uracil-DNA glycosylase
MAEMLTLPGVARKTANVVLTNAYQIPSGIIVDTHVARVSQRLGLTEQTRPERIEEDLMALVPKDEWVFFGSAMVLHGRYTCTARAPKCPECLLNDLCPKRGVDGAAVGAEAGTDGPPRARRAAPRTKRNTPAEQQELTYGDEPERSGRGEDAVTISDLPKSWRDILALEFKKPYFKQLQKFLAEERKKYTVYPPEADVFNAFKLTPYENVNVLLLGQDPYPGAGQAHGLCFSVRPGVRIPGSLLNMFKELKDDLGCKIPNNGYLVPWAEQGVLLLNAVLTVRAGEPNSHKDKGWEQFTDAVIRAVNEKDDPVVFVLWGAYAQKKAKLIDESRHTILTAAHPSPLSAKKFFGSRPFSAINKALKKHGKPEIDWQIPDL